MEADLGVQAVLGGLGEHTSALFGGLGDHAVGAHDSPTQALLLTDEARVAGPLLEVDESVGEGRLGAEACGGHQLGVEVRLEALADLLDSVLHLGLLLQMVLGHLLGHHLGLEIGVVLFHSN